MTERTNCSTIKCDIAEADDIIARFIAKHPNDEHVIVSSDTDFVQLLTISTLKYNGITKETIPIGWCI